MAKVPENRKSSDSDAFAVALRLLTFRDRSRSELAGKLRQRKFDQADIDAVMNRCEELGYLNDERFALTRARALINSGRAVGIRVLNELHKAGIDRSQAERALAEAESEVDLPALLNGMCRNKFPGFDFETASDKEKNRVAGYFQRRGFPISMILDVLKKT